LAFFLAGLGGFNACTSHLPCPLQNFGVTQPAQSLTSGAASTSGWRGGRRKVLIIISSNICQKPNECLSRPFCLMAFSYRNAFISPSSLIFWV
jgi:hypothetical protein